MSLQLGVVSESGEACPRVGLSTAAVLGEGRGAVVTGAEVECCPPKVKEYVVQGRHLASGGTWEPSLGSSGQCGHCQERPQGRI